MIQKFDFLSTLLIKLVGPFLLIGEDKNIIFASSSLTEIIEYKKKLTLCDDFIYPIANIKNVTLSSSCCCWDVFEYYLEKKEFGLWLLKSHNNKVQTTLCELKTVKVGDNNVIIAVSISLMIDLKSKAAYSFFKQLYLNLHDANLYEKAVLNYFKQHYKLNFLSWMDPNEKSNTKSAVTYEEILSNELFSAISSFDGIDIFDILVEFNNTKTPVHCFTSKENGNKKFLVISGCKGFDKELIISLKEAVFVYAECKLSTKKINDNFSSDKSALLEILTPAEKDILNYIKNGMSDKEVAQIREVSIHTVHNQVRSMMIKTGINKRTALISIL